MAVLGQNRFRVELHALDREFLMAHAHDFTIGRPRRYFQAIRQRLALDRERVITRYAEMLRQIGKHAPAIGFDRAYLAVHDGLRAHHASAERFADSLMAQADAENRDLSRELAQHVERDARMLRVARPRRQADPLGIQLRDFIEGNFIVAVRPHVLAQFAEILDQVIGERIVVVDHQQHGLSPDQKSLSRPSCTCSAARSTARALFSVSCHSDSGTESATTPAAACTYKLPLWLRPVRIAMARSISPVNDR